METRIFLLVNGQIVSGIAASEAETQNWKPLAPISGVGIFLKDAFCAAPVQALDWIFIPFSQIVAEGARTPVTTSPSPQLPAAIDPEILK